MSDFNLLTVRDVKAVKRGLDKIQSGLHLVAAVMATSLIKTAVRKMKRKSKRKVRVARKTLKLPKAK